jgi:multimeric flavodoxin WrbA
MTRVSNKLLRMESGFGMKVIAFNGSARKDGNTATLLKRTLRVLEEDSFETELLQLAGEQIHGCTACRNCFETKNQRCVIESDKINLYIQKMIEANGILLGSPTYFAMMSPEMKALIDRTGFVARANTDMFKHKVGAAVVAVRRAGGIPTFDAINNFFLINQMIIPGSSYWNVGIGNKIGDVEKDEEGMKTMDDLGKNMAWLLKKINA